MTTFSMPRPTGFRLRAANEFYAGFVPGSGMAPAAASEGAELTLAFRLDGTFDPVVARLGEDREELVVTLAGTRDVDRVGRQLARMLGLTEAEGWLERGRREPLVGQLQREFAGFFTAAKSSRTTPPPGRSSRRART